MVVLTDIIKHNDGMLLYAVCALQCCTVFIGFLVLMCQCGSAQKRHHLSYTKWSMKWMFLTYIAKWLMDTYDIVE